MGTIPRRFSLSNKIYFVNSPALNRSYIIIWTTFTRAHTLAETQNKQSQDVKPDKNQAVLQKKEQVKQPEKKKNKI